MTTEAQKKALRNHVQGREDSRWMRERIAVLEAERRELRETLKAARTELRCLGRELASANHTATLLDDSVIDQIDEALTKIDAQENSDG